MKILYLIHKFPETSHTFIRNQIHDIITRGHDISILCTFDETAKFDNDPSFQSNIFKRITFGDSYPKSIREWVSWAFMQIVRALREPFFWKALKYLPLRDIVRQAVLLNQILYYSKDQPAPDIIHGHFAINAVALAALRKTGLFQNSRLVVSFHGCDLHHYSGSFYRFLKQETDVFTVNSHFSHKKALELGCAEDKVRVIPASYNSEIFQPQPRKNVPTCHPIRILFVGRLCELKGPHIALKAFSILKKENTRPVYLDMVGEGNMMCVLRKKIDEWDLGESVCLHGSLNQECIKKLMTDSDIFLFPGIADKNGTQEAQGLVIQEAQAMELPVIASNTGGVPEGLLDGKSGFVVEQKDVDTIVEKLLLLCDDNTLRQQMGVAGRDFVQANYSQKIIGNKFESIYYSLNSSRKDKEP
ncbi:MAG: glycosyltransferase [Pontiella sp.]